MQSNNRLVKSMSYAILRDYNIKENTNIKYVEKCIADILSHTPKNKIERRVQNTIFAILRGILKIKKYWWTPTPNFVKALNAIKFFNI